MPQTTKAMTLRLTAEQAATLELIARTDEQSLTDCVRTAIDAHIAARRRDADFMRRLHARRDAERALYERLAE